MSIACEQFAIELLQELEQSPTHDTVLHIVKIINDAYYYDDIDKKLSKTDKKYIVNYMKALAPYSPYMFKSNNADLVSLVHLISCIIDEE